MVVCQDTLFVLWSGLAKRGVTTGERMVRILQLVGVFSSVQSILT